MTPEKANPARPLTEPQNETPHRYCMHCGNCLVWIVNEKDRKLGCLLCKARKAIKKLISEKDQLVNEVDELQAEIIEHEKTCGVLKSETEVQGSSESQPLSNSQREDFFGTLKSVL